MAISDKEYTMKDLVKFSQESGSVILPTFRDSLSIRVEEEAGRKYNTLDAKGSVASPFNSSRFVSPNLIDSIGLPIPCCITNRTCFFTTLKLNFSLSA